MLGGGVFESDWRYQRGALCRVLALHGLSPDVCLSSNTTHKHLERTVARAIGPGHTGLSFQLPSKYKSYLPLPSHPAKLGETSEY
jgi:hypothetical protein